MKKIIIFATIFALTTLLAFRVSAQSQSYDDLKNTNQAPEIQDVEGLRAEFKQVTQNPESKQIEFDMILKSGIDSDRVKINWTLVGASNFLDKNEAIKNITVQVGKTYTIPIVIIPTGLGVTELRAKAEAFKADNSYLVSIRKNFASNDSQEILPITSEYTQAKTLSLVKNVAIAVIVFIILAAGAFYGFKKFAKWLNRDDRR